MKEGIYQGDCLNLINQIPDGLVSAIITDPPYGVSYQSAWRTDKTLWMDKILNDEKPFTEWIEPAFKKLSGGGRLICFYRWDVQEEFLKEIKRVGFNVKSQIVWDKGSHGMGDLKGEFAPQHELMIYATKGRYEFRGKRPKSIYKCQRISGNKLIHPNEKPTNLLGAIIRDITVEDETVLDLFGGSFSTYIAAIKNNRKAISFELHKKYFGIGKKRVDDAKCQLQLF